MGVVEVYRSVRHPVDHCARVAFAWALTPASLRPFENLLAGNILLTADDALFIRYIFIFLYLFHHVIHPLLPHRNTTQELLLQIDRLLRRRLLRRAVVLERCRRNIDAFVTWHLDRLRYPQALGTIVIRWIAFILIVLQVPTATSWWSFGIPDHIQVLRITQEGVLDDGVKWVHGTGVLVFVAVICDLGTHYSSLQVLVVFELFQVLFLRVEEAVEMELRALRALGELRKLAS